MSHIDEGELTAYADGAYAPEDADAQRIAMHIAECANCRNRLAEAQRLSGRASEILAVAAPASMEAPPFEHIAASVPRRTRSRGGTPPLPHGAIVP
jgi:anti-sigma factor ChrR (cupin superfamily)